MSKPPLSVSAGSNNSLVTALGGMLPILIALRSDPFFYVGLRTRLYTRLQRDTPHGHLGGRAATTPAKIAQRRRHDVGSRGQAAYLVAHRSAAWMSEANLDVIVVLGASNDAQGGLTPTAVARAECALGEYCAREGSKMLITGGFGPHFNVGPEPHARYVRRYLVSRGVRPADILGL